MDQQTLINWLVCGGAGVILWVANALWGMIKTLQTDVSNLHIELARNYVPRAELEQRLTRIQDTLDEIREFQRRMA
jgi:predicted O-methyltransferase YrrM